VLTTGIGFELHVFLAHFPLAIPPPWLCPFLSNVFPRFSNLRNTPFRHALGFFIPQTRFGAFTSLSAFVPSPIDTRSTLFFFLLPNVVLLTPEGTYERMFRANLACCSQTNFLCSGPWRCTLSFFGISPFFPSYTLGKKEICVPRRRLPGIGLGVSESSPPPLNVIIPPFGTRTFGPSEGRLPLKRTLRIWCANVLL